MIPSPEPSRKICLFKAQAPAKNSQGLVFIRFVTVLHHFPSLQIRLKTHFLNLVSPPS